jgi:hypothetical protein
MHCFGCSGSLADINKAITAHRQSVNVTPDGHTDMPGYLNNLRTFLCCHFECSGDLADIYKASTFQE